MRPATEVYRLTRKVPDLPWNLYVCRPIASLLVAPLEGTRVTPNQVTLASLAVALASVALLVVLPGRVGLLVAILVFEASYVLDCADGMLARLRGVQSTPGHLFDFLMDEIKAFAVLGAAAVRLFLERDRDPTYLLVGIAGLVVLATGIALTTFVRRPEITGPAGPAKGAAGPRSPLGAVVSAVESVAKLLIHYPSYILFVAISGRLEAYLFPYVAVNAVYAARTLLSVAVSFGRK
ncbi:MAG TPA: CDP-alcohol phosphatidyltransferase family protein [Polyangiaceae bacterium]|nr:CDP-alcohol phosphatidyltransferase family protein [Polyangiaceae bacterium]